ncbi:MAG: Beta-barrel assembly-enhancing protease [Phycisphaerae bacterium]|nr:Beta-barrel assembly-enhancing protease [Phycisphaerae bacterium]
MNQPQEETAYRRVNLLGSLMISGWVIFLLTLAIAFIVLHGRLRQQQRQMAQLNQELKDINDKLGVLARTSGGPAPATRPSALPPGAQSVAGPAATTTPQTQPDANAGGPNGKGSGGGYDVSPVAGLLKPDPDRPAGLAGAFYDLSKSSEPDTKNVFMPTITGPITVDDALAEIRKVEPGAAAKAGIPFDRRLLAAQLFLQTGDIENAHKWARAATDEQANNGTAWLTAGVASHVLKQWQQSIDELTRATALLPDRPEPFKGLAEACVGAARPKQAIEAYRTATKLNPHDLEIASRLADLLIRDGKLDEATKILQSNLAEDGTRAGDRAQLAELFRQSGKPAEALAVLNARPQTADARPDVRLLLAEGRARLDSDELAGAENALEQAVNLSPISTDGWHYLGISRLKQRKNAGAIQALEMAIATDSERAESWQYLGIALANQGEIGKAIERLEEAARLDAKSAQTRYVLTMLYLKESRGDKSLAALRQAVALDATCLDKARKDVFFKQFPEDNPVRKFIEQGPGPNPTTQP